MSCIHCGRNIDPDQTICSDCQQNPKVTVLPPEERENFNGLTIQQAEDGTEYNNSSESNSNPHIYVRHFSFGSAKGNLLTKLLIAAIIILVVFVALPFVLISLAVFIIFFIINRLFIGRISR
jgi:hypothetical protein